MSSQFTPGLDVAQVLLYVFWAFFFGLILWLRREDRREGYPLEGDNPRRVLEPNGLLIPPPKTFLLPEGGEVHAPSFARDERAMNAVRTSEAAGATLEPVGDPMLAGVGAASYAPRADVVEKTREGHDLIVPMRAAEGFDVFAGPDPRGWKVVAADGESPGTVKELWVDRADVLVRYLEIELTEGAGTRLLPLPVSKLLGDDRVVRVKAVRAAHFAQVPPLKEADRITRLEEERISAFFAGGRRYAEPKRAEPIL